MRITIENYSDTTVQIDRRGEDIHAPKFGDPGWHDDYHIHDEKIRLVKPNGMRGYFHANEGEKYIVFKDGKGDYRFAWLDKAATYEKSLSSTSADLG